jgi:hypothetical protein
MNKMQKMIPLLLVSAVLGACGGGGGGSSTPAPAPAPAPAPTPTLTSINDANQSSVSATSYASAVVLNGMVTFAGAAAVQTNENQAQFDVKSLINLQVAEAQSLGLLPGTISGAVTTKTLTCNTSGTYTGTFDDTDNSASLTSGDKINIVYNNCVTNAGAGFNITRNGGSAFNFTKLTASELLATIAYQNLAVLLPASTTSPAYTVTMNGSITNNSVDNTAASTTTSIITIPSLTFTSGGNFLAYTNYQLSETINDITNAYTKSGQGSFTNGAVGSFNLSTPIPFQGIGSGYPSVGKLKIVGSDATAYVTAIDTFSAKLELDKGNDGTIDVTKTAGWGKF